MNIEKTIEFILDNQAKAEERFAKADRRMDRLEGLVEKLARSGEFILDSQAKAEERSAKADGRMDRVERLVEKLVRSGLSLRSDVRELQKFRARSEKFQARTDENLAEITDKLNALIDLVDKSLRRNGGAR